MKEAPFDFEIIKKTMQEKKAWGLLTSLDLYNCNPSLIKDKDAIFEYTVELCNKIEVKRFGDPTIVKFGEDPKVTGYSLVQLIETSLVSGHFADNSDAAYLDIFSCKAYDPKIVLEYTKQFFQAEEHSIKVIYRM